MTVEALTVWMDGFPIAAGELMRTDTSRMKFIYSEDYVAAGGLPLSMSLPLEHDAFTDVEARAYTSASNV